VNSAAPCNCLRRAVISAAAQKTAEDLAAGCDHGIPGGRLSPSRDLGRRAYRNLIYFHEVDKGGHFAAWEQPELFSAELRAAFRGSVKCLSLCLTHTEEGRRLCTQGDCNESR